MKSLVSGLIVLVSVTSAFAGLPNSPVLRGQPAPAAVESAALTEISLDAGYGRKDPLLSGNVSIDAAAKQLKLAVLGSPNCQPGQLCPQFVEQIFDLELPIVAQSTDACGAVTTVARRDDRPADGSLYEVTLTDDRVQLCWGSAEAYVASTSVKLVETTAGFNPTHTVDTFSSSASGPALSSQ